MNDENWLGWVLVILLFTLMVGGVSDNYLETQVIIEKEKTKRILIMDSLNKVCPQNLDL